MPLQSYTALYGLYGLATTSLAACQASTCSDVNVSTLFLRNDGDIFINTSDDERNLSTCAPQGDISLLLKNDHHNKKEIYATLLAAQIAAKKVRIRIVDDVSPCQVSYITISEQ